MRRPRPVSGVAAAAILVAGVVSGFAAGPAAYGDTASATDLYVDNSGTCSNTGAGTQALPFCTIQAAADVVDPGQTVHIVWSPRGYTGGVTFTRSGTADQPITITGVQPVAAQSFPPVTAPDGTPSLTFSGVHDVAVVGLQLTHSDSDGIDVTSSQDITLDRLTVATPTNQQPTGPQYDDVSIDGTSSDVTVSRSLLNDLTGYDVQATAGAQHVVVSTNLMAATVTGAIGLTGTTDADVTSNSIETACAPAVSYDGGSSGAAENNILDSVALSTHLACADPTAPLLSVAADSTGGVSADYNAISANHQQHAEYSWGGTDYTSVAAFQAATGQGAHDLDDVTTPQSLASPPAEHSPLVDSANADAPGELATDRSGAPRVDDPLVADTGAGAHGYDDRGAVELQDTVTIPNTEAVQPDSGLAPVAASVPVGGATSSWGEPLTYTVDFGDGTVETATAGQDQLTHTYATPGSYDVVLTVTDAGGSPAVRYYATVLVGTDAPPPNALSAAPAFDQGRVVGGQAVFQIPSDDGFERGVEDLALGDGTQLNPQAQALTHQYPAAGAYTATLTETDLFGRTTTATTTFRAMDAYQPIQPAYDTQVTIAAHATAKVAAAQLNTGAGEAELRVTASGAKAAGTVTAYTDGTTRPSTANLDYNANQTVTNQMTLPITANGSVDFYNSGSQPVTVTIDTQGYFTGDHSADPYTPTTPTRLLDTRNGTGGVTGPVAANHAITLTVTGAHGIPTDADAVLLNVAVGTTQAAGSLTVATHGATGSAVTGTDWNTGEAVANLVEIPVVDGKVVLTNVSKGSANIVADVVGWYGPATTGGSGYWPVTPARVLDTQLGTGMPGGKVAKIAAHGTVKLKIAGANGLPPGATAADLNLTVTSPSANSYLTAYADGTTRPGTLSVNYDKGYTTADQSIVQVGSDGEVDVYNAGSTAVDVYGVLLGGYISFPAN